MEFSSKLLEEAVDQISLLPGIGKRTALRLALHLLKQEKEHTKRLAEALMDLTEKIQYCGSCHTLSDSEICEICSNPSRHNGQICVVEDLRDVMAIENTAQFQGLYHVLGGRISPLEGIGPQDLKIPSLIEKVRQGEVKEVILALSATLEGDTTNFYIYRQLEGMEVQLTTIARGVPIGDELQYADEVTLGRSILQRIPFEEALKSS
ncbi:recombination mediator RecR [Aureicoccus marinus]|uniref:Recombination protein RecR n=1 Tax=Aureicoccus marinus TaxID=754435 RepID=A0A2S7T6J1_9FLAO|nr:recombination mediator RecR [Aureicoccus marinus]PQJ15530.1 recombination protein RecR [Aureicoccus marinus]